MKENELQAAIERIEKEIECLHTDYQRMLNQCEAFHDIVFLRLKIKQAEESLRLKKRIFCLPASN
jgi:hypothetical protein